MFLKYFMSTLIISDNSRLDGLNRKLIKFTVTLKKYKKYD